MIEFISSNSFKNALIMCIKFSMIAIGIVLWAIRFDAEYFLDLAVARLRQWPTRS